MAKLAIMSVAFLALIAVCHTALHSIPLVQKVHSGQDLADFWAKQAHDATKDNLKLLQYIYRKDYLLANVSIGLPPTQNSDTCLNLESFQLAIETGSPSTFVFSPNFRLLAASQKPYDSNNSMTSDFVSEQYSAQSGTLKLSGSHYKDLMKTQNSFFKAPFGVINKVQRADNFGQVGFPVDGVLGLSWTNDDTNQPIKRICENYSNGSTCWYSLWLGPHKAPSRGQSKGKLMFKNWDFHLCSENFVQFIPLTYNDNNAVPTFLLTSFSFGYVITTSSTRSVIVDSGFSEIVLPAEEYEAVMNAINPDYDTSTNLLVVKCDSQLPDLTFVAEGGLTLSVTKKQYLLDMDLPDNNCAVAIGQQLPSFMASDFILGNPFLRSYCVAYDRSLDGSLQIDIRDSLTNKPANSTTQSTSAYHSTTSRGSTATSRPTSSDTTSGVTQSTTPRTSTATKQPPCCPNGWTYLQQTRKCHKVIINYFINWTEALQACEAEGGTLTSIHSDAESIALFNYAYGAIWLDWIFVGLYNNQSSMQWTDGSDTVYAQALTNWDGTGDPNDTPPPYCVEASAYRRFTEAKMSTIDCSDHIGSFGLCEHSPSTCKLF